MSVVTLIITPGTKEELVRVIWQDVHRILENERTLPEDFMHDLITLGGEVMTMLAICAASDARKACWDSADQRPVMALTAARLALAKPTDKNRQDCLSAAKRAWQAALVIEALRGTSQQPENLDARIAAAVACQMAAKVASWSLGNPQHARGALLECLKSAHWALSQEEGQP